MKKILSLFLRPIQEVRLYWMLFRDPRVHPILKLIPILCVAYLLSPFDLLPDRLVALGLGFVDDLLLLVLGLWLFSMLVPKDIVKEHIDDMRSIKVKYKVQKTEGPSQ